MIDLSTFVDLITRGGLLTALILALIGGMKGWYIWKDVHDKMITDLQNQLALDRKDTVERLAEITREKEYWRDQAVRALTAVDRTVRVVEATHRNDP